MNSIGRRVRAAVNPMSTAVTSWWCHSAMRRTLTGHGPSARQRQLIRLHLARRARLQVARHARLRKARGTRPTPSAVTMQARAAAIDELLARDDR